MRLIRSSLPVLAAAVVLGACGGDDDLASRQRVVAERGSEVMPFDLDATTHRFVKRADGGLQVVVADRPDDRRQVALVREHLEAEARAFRRGEFDDPAAIHGTNMPGLDVLRRHGGALRVDVADRPDGAQLRFTTADPRVRAALHDWFDAQVSDHGTHADG